MKRNGENQKLKMLYLVKIFNEETDDSHFLTLREIIQRLEECGIMADRKTLYVDFDELRRFGVDIIMERIGRKSYYHIGSRNFELPELKLLVDAVQSARGLTDKKSGELIKKLEGMVSKYEAKQLNRQVFIAGRVKTMNESVYYNIDAIHEAISTDKQIRFKYYKWDLQKKMKLRKEGDWFQVSPWVLIWDNEYYYLIAYDAENQKIKHYRVDKMLKISLVDEKREGKEQYQKFDITRYTKSLFGMFGGEETKVTLEAENAMVNVIIDRFGKDIIIQPVDPDHFRTSVNVSVSSQFLGWIIALGDKVRIVGPNEVVDQMKSEISRLMNQYSVTE
ncbi:MAG: WYL domain-containing protein [Anaerolineaceae bacterium]|nr:WYL domain-containing protein [Anaerolineaceae bacterium]